MSGKKPSAVVEVPWDEVGKKEKERLSEVGLPGHGDPPSNRIAVTENKDGSGHLYSVFL